jgi:hypothetical protein
MIATSTYQQQTNRGIKDRRSIHPSFEENQPNPKTMYEYLKTFPFASHHIQAGGADVFGIWSFLAKKWLVSLTIDWLGFLHKISAWRLRGLAII